MEHQKLEHKHVAEPETASQAFVHRILLRILELSTIELIVAVLHLCLTAVAVFGLVGTTGGH